MADFSRYGGASLDWEQVVASIPKQLLVGAIPDASEVPDEQQLLKIQAATNRERSVRAKRALQEIVGRSTCRLPFFWDDMPLIADLFSLPADLGKLTVSDYACPTSDDNVVPIRVYRPMLSTDQRIRALLPVYIWFHGGGFLFGSLDGEDAHCTQTALRHGVIVVNICYRHTPHWKWPTPRQDGLTALDWVFDNMTTLGGEAGKVIIAGRSAGGLVAATTAIGDLKAVSTGILPSFNFDIDMIGICVAWKI
jgi:hypothetical protein